MMRFTSVRFRMTIWNIGVLAVVLFGFLFVAHVSIRSYLISAMDRRLSEVASRQADFFAHVSDMPRPPRPPRQYNNRHGRNSENRWQRMMRMFDLHGREITPDMKPDPSKDQPWDHAAFAQAATGRTVFSIAKDADVPLRVLSRPLLRDGKQVGVLQTAFSYAETQALLESLTKQILLMVPCALILAGLGGLLLTNRALQPVRRIIHAATMLDSEDLSQRLPVAGADEFAHLATTMNGMLDRLEIAFAQLKHAIERERLFTADASHELRTPLTAIKANTTLALRGERTPAQYREALLAIDQGAAVMNRLVQDMLLLARSDSDQLSLNCQQISLPALFSEAIALTQSDKPRATIRTEIAEGAESVWGDQHHLQRLLVNLLENALRHTPVDGEITLQSMPRGEQTALLVCDTGEGIAPEHLSHLGERFYRVDAARARQHGGTGLGFAICKSIVTAHHGTLEIESTPGKGTYVTVLLPKGQNG